MTHEEFEALNWRDQRRPSNLAKRWRELGRDWATLGEQERSELAHSMADYWSQPIWLQIFTVYEARAIEAAIKKHHNKG